MFVNLVGSMMEKKLLATNTRHNVKTDHSLDVICFFISIFLWFHSAQKVASYQINSPQTRNVILLEGITWKIVLFMKLSGNKNMD